MVDCGGLENRCPFAGTGGSNPSLSAGYVDFQYISRQLYNIYTTIGEMMVSVVYEKSLNLYCNPLPRISI